MSSHPLPLSKSLPKTLPRDLPKWGKKDSLSTRVLEGKQRQGQHTGTMLLGLVQAWCLLNQVSTLTKVNYLLEKYVVAALCWHCTRFWSQEMERSSYCSVMQMPVTLPNVLCKLLHNWNHSACFHRLISIQHHNGSSTPVLTCLLPHISLYVYK